MKKHIIIAGVPRSEKSTLSQKISKGLGYQHISMDSFTETGIDSDADIDLWENIRYISSKMSLFICAMMDSGEYDECDYGMVIDIFQLLPEHYIQYINPSVCSIYYLGTSEVSPEERYRLLKKYDTPKDYTYYKSEEENKENCLGIVMIGKKLEHLCRTYNLPYFDTSYNRKRIFETILSDVDVVHLKKDYNYLLECT